MMRSLFFFVRQKFPLFLWRAASIVVSFQKALRDYEIGRTFRFSAINEWLYSFCCRKTIVLQAVFISRKYQKNVLHKKVLGRNADGLTNMEIKFYKFLISLCCFGLFFSYLPHSMKWFENWICACLRRDCYQFFRAVSLLNIWSCSEIVKDLPSLFRYI